jgi:hypothetical protein
MPNTPKGLPYPVATDPVAGGAAAIQALAVAVDAQLRTTYRKTTPKVVAASVAETDLLNGELTVAAGALGTNRLLRITAFGDWLLNGGPTSNMIPRFKLKLGAAATPVIDTGAIGNDVRANVSRWGWRLLAEIQNTAAGAQAISFNLAITYNGGVGTVGTTTPLVVGEGVYAIFGGIGIATAFGVNTSAIDTSVAMPVAFAVINPNSNALCETKLLAAEAEVVA